MISLTKHLDDGFAETSPVGSFPDGASPYGVLDMSGNVLEWVADWYAADYYQRSPTSNPLGPDSGRHASCAAEPGLPMVTMSLLPVAGNGIPRFNIGLLVFVVPWGHPQILLLFLAK